MNAIWLTILVALITGLLGALISTMVHIRRENRMFKVQTLKKFAAHRNDITGDSFSEALNEIVVVYNDSREVMEALEDFHRIATTGRGRAVANDGLVRLYKAMCENAKVKHDHFNDSFFLSPFNIKQKQVQPRTPVRQSQRTPTE